MTDLDKFQNIGWKLSGAIASYAEARRFLRYLRQAGYFSTLSEHQVAYDYALSRSDKQAIPYFEFIIAKEGME